MTTREDEMPNGTPEAEPTPPPALKTPCGFCHNELHDLCPRFVHANNGPSPTMLACPCVPCGEAKGGVIADAA